MKKMKKIILEGCNGDWSQKHYLPFLIKKVIEGDFELWAIDRNSEMRIDIPKINKLWQKAQNNVHYLNKEKNKKIYETLSNIDYVFIVTPDRFHCEIAEFWLDRLSSNGRIFIEKPLDASVEKARRLKNKIGNQNIVYNFDHYLAKAYPFFQNKSTYLEGIGQIKKIEFHILESYGIPKNRAESLKKGVIFDLFSHDLSLIDALFDSEFLSTKIKVGDVKAARYINAPIPEETFAWIKLHFSNIKIEAMIGKSVGKSDDIYMNIYGTRGEIKIDFVKNEFFVFDSQKITKKRGYLNTLHVKDFLKEILQGKEPLSVLGVLSFDTAFEILLTLNNIKEQIGKTVEYQQNEVLNDILKKF